MYRVWISSVATRRHLEAGHLRERWMPTKDIGFQSFREFADSAVASGAHCLLHSECWHMPSRIRFEADVISGRACIRGRRFAVSRVVNLVTNGMSVPETVTTCPYPELEDIRQSLRYVAWLAEE